MKSIDLCRNPRITYRVVPVNAFDHESPLKTNQPTPHPLALVLIIVGVRFDRSSVRRHEMPGVCEGSRQAGGCVRGTLQRETLR